MAVLLYKQPKVPFILIIAVQLRRFRDFHKILLKFKIFLDCFSFQNANFHEGVDSISNAGSDLVKICYKRVSFEAF